jgi:hypothetical protein
VLRSSSHFPQKEAPSPGQHSTVADRRWGQGEKEGRGRCCRLPRGIIRRGAPSCRGARYARRAPGRH